MFQDVLELDAFYASPLGQHARRLVRKAVRALWPSVRGEAVLGLGYAPPYLHPLLDEAERVLALMPAAQGCRPWPRDSRNRVALVEEAALPLPNACMDRVLLSHCVEQSEALRPMLREVWRVLKPTGRLLVMAPNRRSLWAQLDVTPFGHGIPFSNGQLQRLLREALFAPGATQRALFLPPVRSRTVLASAKAWERAGRRWFPTFCGVILVEASKQLYAGTPLRAEPARMRRPVAATAQARVAVSPEQPVGAPRAKQG
ncbi:MAG: methyltransferase domain-containing protein [Alphaproteobacteria bacterium]|nr:methyltransferase domain-containing protein [Alphaproteobacteria bacterium]